MTSSRKTLAGGYELMRAAELHMALGGPEQRRDDVVDADGTVRDRRQGRPGAHRGDDLRAGAHLPEDRLPQRRQGERVARTRTGTGQACTCTRPGWKKRAAKASGIVPFKHAEQYDDEVHMTIASGHLSDAQRFAIHSPAPSLEGAHVLGVIGIASYSGCDYESRAPFL